MPRRFDSEKLVLATHNRGKISEFSALLGEAVPVFANAADLDLPEPEETGQSFEENAILKAKAAVAETGLPALADDSGLAVTALGGAPGIYAARWAETEDGRDFKMAMERVHRELGDTQDRSAAFVCVLALAWPDGHTEVFEGRVEGQIVWPPRGDRNFGYDPIFVPDGYEKTFAEFDPEAKNRISHRARAFQKLLAGCFSS